ncbi:hypothetical protein B0O80DRAFT_433660 [Mortierella sp. GBAus27b]|nr:hypothetical protein B0O80DRAFT_433660 [Mortierella sp. GBAus27b]
MIAETSYPTLTIMSSTTVSVFGLGAMGVALAQKFLEAGYKTKVWNRTQEKAEPLVKKGAHLAKSVAEGLESSNLIVICLLDYKAVNDTLSQARSLLQGRIVVNLTNGTPEHARETGVFVLAQGAQYIHGGIMTTPQMIGTPTAVLLYSGAVETYQSVERDLSILGTGKHLSTDNGAASLYDLALLSGTYGLFGGFIHSVSLVRSQEGQTSVAEFLSSLLVPWLTQVTGYLHLLAKQIDEKNFATQGSSIAMQIPAIQNIVQVSKDRGVSSELIHPIQRLLDLAVASGRGNDDLSALVELTADIKED